MTQLKNGSFVSVLYDGSINIYCLLENSKYLLLQKIKAHSCHVHKLRVYDEDNRFFTCSDDWTIKFFFKEKKEYKNEYTFKDDFPIYNISKTRERELVYSGNNSSSSSFIKFFDMKSRKVISSSKVKQLYNGLNDYLFKPCDKYLLIGANNSILVFDVNQHQQIREIESTNSGCITSFLKLDKKCLLSVDYNGTIKQWIMDEDNLILENVKNKAHEGQIRMIRINHEGLIITCSDDKSLKIWRWKIV